MVKSFLIGAMLGTLVAGPIAYNYGRDAPLLSNPFQDRSVSTLIREQIDNIQNLAEDVKAGFKEVTRQRAAGDSQK